MGKPVEQLSREEKSGAVGGLQQLGRVATFWRRGIGVYFAYKGAQVRAAFLRKRGWSAERLRTDFWAPHHAWAGDEFYSMCIDLRGFYLKIGQFFAARAEFVPEPICKRLSRLHDQVPPMDPEKTRTVIESELGGVAIEDVFEWLDLQNVLGSASIAQVHKAKLRGYSDWKRRRNRLVQALLAEEPQDYEPKKAHDVRRLFRRGQKPKRQKGDLDPTTALGEEAQPAGRRDEDDPTQAGSAAQENKAAEASLPTKEQNPRLPSRHSAATARLRAAAETAANDASGPEDGIVAVKVQYPDALPVMMTDLKQIRRFGGIIQKLEINFDMLSAVDELAAQVKMEFDFKREAAVMDAVGRNLKALEGEVVIPKSVPGLVTKRLLVMSYIDGEQITRLKSRVEGLSPAVRKAAQSRILHRVVDAYGLMMIKSGLFQADPHPGNILIMRGGKVGLIDYGQSKQLSTATRLAFALLIQEMAKGRKNSDPQIVSKRLQQMGLEFDNDNDLKIQAMMAFGMFDTEKSHKVDPFSPDSPIKKLGIRRFPPEAFFVLRTIQMLRGLSIGMKQDNFSSAKRWKHLADAAVVDI